MKTKKKSQKLIHEIISSQKASDENNKAMESYNLYKKAFDLIERTNIALGRKSKFTTSTNSTLNLEVNHLRL